MTERLEGYLTASDLAGLLRVSKSGVYSWVQRGILPPGVKFGHSRRWNMAELRTFLKGVK